MDTSGAWELVRVNHCELLRAYYGGAAAVRRSSVRLPRCAPVTSGSGSGSDKKRRASKKRKRAAEEALAQLAARGKFVPLDARVRCVLQAAHAELLRDFSAAELLPAWPVAFDAAPDTQPEPAALAPPALELELSPSGGGPALLANDCDRVRAASVASSAGARECVLLPPRARFAAADVRRLGELGLPRGAFRWIVMDPPWENKSVSRARSYETLGYEELLRVDVAALADPRASVLAVWVTNKPAHEAFLRERALPAWGFALHDMRFWLKVRADGALVAPLASTHRLPFEKLLVAYRGATEAARAELRRLLGSGTRVVASVPLRHSWKPPPESFFAAGAVADADAKIELFARELRPRWTSVGLEVTKFQSAALFDVGPC